MSTNRCEAGIDTFRHHLPLQMRFNDIDLLGHLNNSVYLTFMDLAKARYFEEVNGGPVDIRTMGVVIVNINANFCIPTFFHEQIEAETAVVAIGEKSITLEQRIYSVPDRQVKCSCRTVMAGFDIRTNTSIPISEEWVKKFEAYEGRKLQKIK
ncbi:thioesterase family protein [uncultured Duncaniella sp.]|uniref:acyl-CoA thioesterase n=1 Tax=uncultured Duncaniella sp. TaxID=2768039 RepID=UPI002626DF84|nr:thioesterase family protein [uncultured Duncaniella sp.]